MIIYKQFSFDSAHFLPNVPDGHKCRKLHGHTYHLTVFVEGEIHDPEGWILDFSDLKKVFKPGSRGFILSQSQIEKISAVGFSNPGISFKKA